MRPSAADIAQFMDAFASDEDRAKFREGNARTLFAIPDPRDPSPLSR